MNFLAGARTGEMRPIGSNVDEAELWTSRQEELHWLSGNCSLSSLGFYVMPNKPA